MRVSGVCEEHSLSVLRPVSYCCGDCCFLCFALSLLPLTQKEKRRKQGKERKSGVSVLCVFLFRPELGFVLFCSVFVFCLFLFFFLFLSCFCTGFFCSVFVCLDK